MTKFILWLIKRYGLRMAAFAAAWAGWEIGTDVLEGISEEYGRDVARKWKDHVAEARQEKAAAPVSAPAPIPIGVEQMQEEFAANLESESGISWISPDREADELLRDECAAWKEFEDESCS